MVGTDNCLYYRDMEKVHYIYKITLLCGSLAGKYYLGKHTTKNVKDGYAGSGKIVSDYFKKYGKKKGVTYLKEILEFNETMEINSEREQEIIGSLWETDPDCLNCCKGGSIGGLSTTPWNKGKKGCFSDDTIKKMSDAKKGKPSPFKGMHGRYTEDTLKKISKSGKGRKHTEEWKKDNSERMKGHAVSEITREKISNANKGKKHSKETKIKMMIPIVQLSLDGEYIREWHGATEVENTIGLSHKQIWKCLKGYKKDYGGFKWKYKEAS